MRVELFNSEITQTICHNRLLRSDLFGTTLCEPNREQLEEYIFRQTIINDTTERNATSAIITALGTLHAAGGELCLTSRNQHIRDLASRLVEYQGKSIPSSLHPSFRCIDARSSDSHPTATRNSTAAAAAHLGQMWYFQKIDSWGIEHFKRSCYFGSPLACAARRGHVEITQLLLDRMLELKAREPHRFEPEIQYMFHLALYPIGEASAGGHEDIIDLILDPKYGFHPPTKQINEAIFKAAQNGHVRIIRRLLRCLHNPPMKIYNLILSEGAHRNQPEVVQFALANGADPNNLCMTRGRCAWPPLSLATIRGHQSMAELLLSHGANQIRRNTHQEGKTDPLGAAARRGYKKLVRLFVENGAPSESYPGALVMASGAGQADLVVYLLSGEAGMNFLPPTCRIGLKFAEEGGWISVAQLLTEHLRGLEKL
jgi:hypothetical protein